MNHVCVGCGHSMTEEHYKAEHDDGICHCGDYLVAQGSQAAIAANDREVAAINAEVRQARRYEQKEELHWDER